MPNDFDLLFLTDWKRYTFSLKDAKDPCYFAIFSDHDGLIYATMPEPEKELTAVDRRRSPGETVQVRL